MFNWKWHPAVPDEWNWTFWTRGQRVGNVTLESWKWPVKLTVKTSVKVKSELAGHRSVFIHWFCKWLLLLLVTWSVERISVTFFTSGLCSGRDRTHRAAVSNYRPALRLSTSVNLAAAIRFRPAPSSHCQRLTSGFRNFLRCTLESLSLSRLGMNDFFFLFSKQNSWSRSRQPRWSLRHWNGWLDAFDGYNYIKRSSH